ncbi:MAG: hypothetical protein LM593_00485 [Candidatus Verstraetearchaeota archaeon]|jgi:hypothetical protein|nr:hypothetical protein [Candidatus Verstraetearchaeota archaeon]
MSIESFKLADNEILIMKGKNGLLGIAKAKGINKVIIESFEKEMELIVNPEDIIVVSCFSNNEKFINGIACMIYLIKEIGIPLISFPKERKTSFIPNMLIAIGKNIILTTKIEPGKEKQNMLCVTKDFDNMEVISNNEEIVIKGIDKKKVNIFKINQPHIQYMNNY